MGRTVSLKGAAAGAFLDSKMGVRAKTDEERVERVLTWLEVQLKAGAEGRAGARLIVNSLVTDGLEKTADRLTLDARIVGAPVRESPNPPAPPLKLTGAWVSALHEGARGGGTWRPTGVQVRVARRMADHGLGEWFPTIRRFMVGERLFLAYTEGWKEAGHSKIRGATAPNPYGQGTVEKVLWDLGFQDGAAEKEGG